MMEIKIVTTNDDVYSLRKIHRRHLDVLMLGVEMPQPPMREVEVFGGDIEKVPILNDPEYLRQLQDKNLEIVGNNLGLVFEQVTILELTEETKKIALAFNDQRIALFRNIEDVNVAIDKLFYLSTVTNKAIQEHSKILDVKWMGKELTAWELPYVPSKQSSFFRDVSVAKEYNFSWDDFCDLDGVTQSLYVAHSYLSAKLNYFTAKWMIKSNT